MDRRSDLNPTTPYRTSGTIVSLLVFALVTLACPAGVAVAASDGTFEEVYEPSGIAPLPDGRLLVVDDEPARALHLITPLIDEDGITFDEQIQLDPPDGLIENLKLGKLDDLEGAAHDSGGRIYVITSQDKSGLKSSDRRKLARFVVDSSRMSEVAIRTGVRDELLSALPELELAMKSGGKHDRELDVEAIAMDRHRGVLVLGLRTPRVGEQAVLVAIDNPDDWLDNDAALSARVLRVDLDGGGVRAMAYDAATDSLLIVSRNELEKKAPYLFWSLPAAGDAGATPRSLPLDDEKLLDDVEGVTLLENGVLFVRDDGNRKKDKPGTWFFRTRESLGLDDVS